MKSKKLFLIFFIFTGCGFSSGIYKDILVAQEYLTERKFQKAVKVYESILAKKPSLNIQIKINDQLGDIYSIYLNNYEKSLRHYKEIESESNEPLWQVRSLEKIGNIYFEKTKNFQAASVAYLKLAKFIPSLEKQAFYKFRYALSLLYNHQTSLAIIELKKIIKEKQVKYIKEANYYIGLAHFYKQQWVQAREYWFEYLKIETRKDKIVNTKFLIANAYESSEHLKEAYNIYYSILGEYPNPEIIQSRLNSLYERRIARKR
jgi:tetratricopeptide (TPR) repeat protein